MQDFYDRVKTESVSESGKRIVRRVNKKVVESLIAAGAFDSFGTRNEMMAGYYGARKEKEAPVPLTDEQWEEKEREMTGLCLSKPPLYRQYEDLIRSKKWRLVSQIDEGKRIMVFGRVENVRSHVSKAGNSMYVVQFSDGIDSMSFMVFAASQQYFRDHLKVGSVAGVPLSRFDDGDNRFFDERGQIEVVKP
jgi:DNA polymerase III alpha subunit